MAADPGPLRWAWSKTAAPADDLDLIKYDDAGAVGTTVATYVRADSSATFVGSVTAPAVFVGANPVIADPAAGNALVVSTTGMFVPASAVSVPTVIPATATISSVENPVGTFTLGVVVSATAGNTLSAVADGLFVPTPAAQVPTVITPGNGVSATELPPGTWAVGLVVDPAAGNVLVNSATGLFVPTPAAATPTVITDTPTVDATELPPGTFALAVKISPVATSPGNMVTAAADGIAVLPGAIPISADPGNLLELRADGFYVRSVGLVFGMP